MSAITPDDAHPVSQMVSKMYTDLGKEELEWFIEGAALATVRGSEAFEAGLITAEQIMDSKPVTERDLLAMTVLFLMMKQSRQN